MRPTEAHLDVTLLSRVTDPGTDWDIWVSEKVRSVSSPGRPYYGGAVVGVATPCADMSVYLTFWIYAPDFVEDKTQVIGAMKEAAEKYALEDIKILRDAVVRGCRN